MTRLYLVSSAESEAEAYRIAQSHYDMGLSGRGWRQAEALRERFAEIPLDALYASDRYRAHATAQALRQCRDLPIHRREDLRDMYLGPWEGQNWGNLAYDKRQEVDCFQTTPGRWSLAGAEEPSHAAQRLLSALRIIAEENCEKSVAVISHTLIIQLAQAVLDGEPLEGIRWPSGGGHTAVTIMEVEAGALRITRKNDTCHLQEECCRETRQPEYDMYLQPLHWVEYGDAMAQAVACVWDESGETRLFDRDKLLADAAMLPTTIGYVEYEPAGFLQLGLEPGWITLLCTHPGCRRAGLGTQLVGQAVIAARERGADALHIAPPPGCPHRDFFLHLGFRPAGRTEEGRELLEKDVRLRSELF